MSEHYQGSCHCGAVRFSFEGDKIEKGLRCNCSICSRKGAMMTPQAIPPEDFTIEAETGALGLYQFGAKTAKHYFCKHCGIYTFHETARFAGHYRANLGCIEGVDPFVLEYDLFDGKHLL
ncbi:MAG: GFA family protein [Candidatus Thiodiazotropha sp.]